MWRWQSYVQPVPWHRCSQGYTGEGKHFQTSLLSGKKKRQIFPMVFLVAILVKVFIIHHHKNDMHNMARSDFFWGGGSGFSSTKASNNTCSSCFHSLAEIGDLKKARPMISSENGFHGGSPEAHQQFWPKTFGSQLGRMKKNKTKKPAFHTHTLSRKLGKKSYSQITIQFCFLSVTLIVFLFSVVDVVGPSI